VAAARRVRQLTALIGSYRDGSRMTEQRRSLRAEEYRYDKIMISAGIEQYYNCPDN
jgi:hypothetical protein